MQSKLSVTKLDAAVEAIEHLQDVLDELNDDEGPWADGWPEDEDVCEALEAAEEVLRARKGLVEFQKAYKASLKEI